MLEDVVAGPLLPEVAELVQSRPLHVIVLLPSAEAVSARDSTRGSSGYEHWSIGELYEAFAANTPRIGVWLDTSDQTPAETVESILARTTPTS